MVEELKLAIKVDDDAIEQSLLKQFANAEKMANKVVLTFNNIDLDDKAIEAKFKEMQKMAGKNPIDLSIDKSSIEMLSAISKQLGNIFDIAKGKSIIDSSATVSEINKITQATKELNKAQTGSENIQSKSFTTKNKTEAYNQLKQTADVFKQFYGNEEAMHTKAGTEAAYAYYKAYEEALRKGVAESKLQKVTVDVDKDGFFNAERISSTRIEEFANFEKYGGEVTTLSEEIAYFEKRLLKFSDAYSQIQSKLGKAPITPEIIQNIEEYVRNLEIAESRTKDADLMGFTKEDIDIYKDSANMYLGFAIEDAIKENEKYISSLKEVSEEKEKVDVSLNKSQTSDIDSSVVEQQNKIQEELKETQKQAEQTSEALSKIGDGNKSNISSENIVPIFDDSKEVSKIENIGDAIDGLLTDIKGLKHYTDEVFDSFDSNMFGSGIGENRLGNAAYFFDEKNMGDWKDIGEYSKYLTTWSANQVKLFDQTLGFTEEEIERIIKEFYSDLDDDIQDDYKFDLKNIMDDDLYEFRSKFGVELQDVMKSLGYDAIKSNSGEYAFYNTDKLIREVQVYDNEANKIIEVNNKVAQSIKETSSTASSTPPIEDVFQGDKIDQVTTSAKELDNTLEQVNIPTDSFDDVLSKLDLTESKLKEIVKITKQSVSDSEGKFHDSYTLKDKRGSTEIYGLSSNTEKGQLLRSNIVGYDAKEIEQEAKAVQKLAEEKRKLRQQEKQSTQSSVDKALKDQVSAWKQIQSIREKIAKSNDANEIENLKKVKKEYQQSYIEADKILKTNSDIYDKEAQIARLEQVRLETNKKIADYKNPDISSMESSLARFEESSEKLSLKPDNEHSFESWKLKIDELNNAINEYRNKITELQSKDGIIDKEDISEATELENRIKSLLREMQKTSSGDKGFEDISATKIAEQIHKLLEDNTAMSRKAKAEIQAYYDEVASGNPSRPLKEIYNDALKVVQAERAMGREGKSFLDTMKDKAWYGWAAQITSMFGVYDIINIFKQGANTLKEFDDGLTKISYTMDMTKSQLDNLGKSVLDMASDMKSSIDDAMQVAQIYANMQTSAEEIQRLSEPTLILSNLSGFDSSTIADDIQAVTQQFDILAEDSMHIADVYDYISRNIAVDYSKGLNAMAEGLQVAGSTAKQAGLSYEQTASIIAKAVEKTRLEGSQVGNGLKTIMTRLSKVGELSEEVDNETLSQASESLKKVGIEVYNLDGSYREFDVIMGELAGKWDNLTDAEKSNISFNIAATRQTNLLSAVLSNFSDSMQLAEEATNANGSALENQQKYMESFSGHLQSLETEAKIAWLNILDSETLKDGVDLLTGLVKVVGQLIDTFGLLGTAAGIGGIVAGFKNVGQAKMWACLIYAYPC